MTEKPFTGSVEYIKEQQAATQRRIAYKLGTGEIERNENGVLVCSLCKGNCGQCGLTDILGDAPPASLASIILGEPDPRELYVKPPLAKPPRDETMVVLLWMALAIVFAFVLGWAVGGGMR